MDSSVTARIDALEQTWQSLGALLDDLHDDDWHLPTGCPGWDVQDVVSHLCGLERFIHGEFDPPHELPGGLAHVRPGPSEFFEVAVDLRRGRAHTEVLAEFHDLVPRRLAALRADETPADRMLASPLGGEASYRRLLTLRVFDCYAHEQDIRRATDHHGNLSGPAANLVRHEMIRGWSGLVSRSDALGGVRVVVELDGEPHLLSGPEPEQGSTGPELVLRTTFENAVALACGRSDARVDQVTVIGDGALFEALRPGLALTP